jgi:hypothetical protein
MTLGAENPSTGKNKAEQGDVLTEDSKVRLAGPSRVPHCSTPSMMHSGFSKILLDLRLIDLAFAPKGRCVS